ncbi:MAG: hypothetical protein JWN47_1764, partial [Frankiales bacterium]|nr:hypothetical protein [Frankiales bacterium]
DEQVFGLRRLAMSLSLMSWSTCGLDLGGFPCWLRVASTELDKQPRVFVRALTKPRLSASVVRWSSWVHQACAAEAGARAPKSQHESREAMDRLRLQATPSVSRSECC